MVSLTLQLTGARAAPTIFGGQPASVTEGGLCTYGRSPDRVAFTGGLLLAQCFKSELYVHMGFHPPWKYEVVRELSFEDGRLSREVDRSSAMAEIRARLAARSLGPDGTNEVEVGAWVEQCFDRSYL